MRETNRKPTLDELYMGGKTPELALFYNIAFFKTAGLLHLLIYKTIEDEKPELEKTAEAFRKKTVLLSDAGYTKMREYLWKGYRMDKNPTSYHITEEDKGLIDEMLEALHHLRNFHSHMWHDNHPLVLSNALRKHVIGLHDWAMQQQRPTLGGAVQFYEEGLVERPLFKKQDDGTYLTGDGRNFFLSFFLTTGEMTRFLKQRKGCKRDDTPEFKVKHKVYRYYTHRDGATRNHYGFEDNLMKDLPQKNEILKVRQAYKIISYLNDVPHEITDPQLFPLYNEGNDTPIEKAADYLALITQLNLWPDIHFFLLKSHKKEELASELDYSIGFELTDDTRWQFRIGTKHLHQLLLNGLRHETYPDTDGTPLAYPTYMVNCLHRFIEERNRLVDIVRNNTSGLDDAEEESKLITDYYVYKHRSNDKVRTKLGAWFDAWNANKAKNSMAQRNLLEILNQTDAPIELSYYDFYAGQAEKPRRDDRFIPFAVRYFIDFKLVPDLEWKIEQLTEPTGDELPATFSESIPEGCRVHLCNGHATARYQGAIVAMGYRTLQNLLIAHFEGKNLTSFFSTLAGDLRLAQNLCSNASPSFTLLDTNAHPAVMPAYMRRLAGDHSLRADVFEVNRKVKNRIENLIITFNDQLVQFKEGTLRMDRASKNRQVMRCYRLYNWKYTNNPEYKFLRNDEYQYMSIFHYSLDADRDDPRKPSKPSDHQARKKARLFDTLIKEQKIDLHLPVEILELLREATSFDDLFVRTLQKTVDMLTKWRNGLSAMSAEKRNTCMARLGFSLSMGAPAEKVNAMNKNLSAHLPFNLHPLLPIRFFYPAEMAKNDGRFSLSLGIRTNLLFTDGLRTQHYNAQAYNERFTQPLDHKKIVGALNLRLTLDALLWKIALQYLEDINPKLTQLASGGVASVQNMRNTPLIIDVGTDLPHIKVQMHQLDDFMFIESRPMLANIVKYYLRRTGQTTTQVQELDYNEVHTELQRIYHDSLRWIGFLFAWERTVLDTLVPAKDKQQRMPKADKRYAYFEFNEICAYVKNVPGVLKDLRNKALHVGIPEEWTYAEKQNDASITKTLGITSADFEKRIFLMANEGQSPKIKLRNKK